MSTVKQLLVGKRACANHPQTVLNPGGTDGFIITDAAIENGKLFVRGEETCWYGEGLLLYICDEPKVPV